MSLTKSPQSKNTCTPKRSTSKPTTKVKRIRVEPSTNIKAFLKLLHPDGVFEIRVMDTHLDNPNFRRTSAGYFNQFDAAEASIAEQDEVEPRGIYVTLNSVEPSLLARSKNFMYFGLKPLTHDTEIVSRRWIVIDIDPIRRKGISSTQQELNAAFKAAREIRKWLNGRGWPAPVLMMSGNGVYLLYLVGLPNDDESTDLVRGFLGALENQFNSDVVEIDQSVSNAARLIKVAGTIARKGDELIGEPGIEDRRHRKAYFYPPSTPVKVVPRELIEAVVNLSVGDTGSQPDASTRVSRSAKGGKGDKSSPKQSEPREQRKVSSSSVEIGDVPNATEAVVERCRRCVEKMPPAIEGDNGSSKTFSVACVLARFGLSLEQGESVLNEFNTRCVPPWEPHKLARKLTDAYQRVIDAGEFGKYSSPTQVAETAGQRPVVQWLPGTVNTVVDSICESLGKTNRVFVGPMNELVELSDGGELAPILRDAMATRITEYVQLQRPNKMGVLEDRDCTVELARKVFADQRWTGIPRIKAVSQQPTITSDGRIIERPGLDVESGIYVV